HGLRILQWVRRATFLRVQTLGEKAATRRGRVCPQLSDYATCHALGAWLPCSPRLGFAIFRDCSFTNSSLNRTLCSADPGCCILSFQSGKSWKAPFRNPAGALRPAQCSVLAPFWLSPISSAASEKSR